MPRKTNTTSATKKADDKQSKKTDTTEVIPDVEVTPTTTDSSIVQVETTGEVEDVKGDEVITKDSINDLFDETLQFIENEVTGLKDKETKGSGVKFLRSVIKRIKVLKNKVSKTMKQKKSTRKTSNNVNSGFLKPVGISKELSKFGGWKPDEQISRVSVTKSVCEYIKSNNLQNPEDRRQIIPDAKLSKLLNYDPKKEDSPLTYYKIQSHLKHHFLPKVETASA
jgi:chromatin remodeling complex protein RSC6